MIFRCGRAPGMNHLEHYQSKKAFKSSRKLSKPRRVIQGYIWLSLLVSALLDSISYDMLHTTRYNGATTANNCMLVVSK